MDGTKATSRDWEISPMPEKTAEFIIKLKLNDRQIEKLRHGHIPEEMEDRWFGYMEGDKLYIHRSWSGNCIFIVEFNFKKGKHKVIVNRNPDEYAGDDINEETEEVIRLIGSWSYVG